MDSEPTREDVYAKETFKSKLPLAEQDKCIAELNEVVNMLVDRLESILTPQPESPSKDVPNAAPVQSQVAAELASNNARIRRNISKLSNALQRLEV